MSSKDLITSYQKSVAQPTEIGAISTALNGVALKTSKAGLSGYRNIKRKETNNA